MTRQLKAVERIVLQIRWYQIWNINGFVLVIGATYYPLVTFFTHTTTCTIYLYLSRGWAEKLSLVKMLFKIKLNHHSALWHIYGQPFCFKPIFVWFINQGTFKKYDFSIKLILIFQNHYDSSILLFNYYNYIIHKIKLFPNWLLHLF